MLNESVLPVAYAVHEAEVLDRPRHVRHANFTHRRTDRHTDKGVAKNYSYCSRYGGSYTYRPMFTPPGLGFLRPPPKFPTLSNETLAVPVMRTEDEYPIPFYYWADGCSDTFIHVNKSTAFVAHDRIDAMRRLIPHSQAMRFLVEYCRSEITDAGLQVLPRAILTTSGFTDIDAARTVVSNTGCLNNIIYTTMRRRGLTTLVLNFESPGGDTSGAMYMKKAEIIHLGTRFYDSNGTECALKSINRCYFCANSSLSYATCSVHPLVHGISIPGSNVSGTNVTAALNAPFAHERSFL